MNIRPVFCVILALLLVNSPAVADLVLTPYGSYTSFSNLSSQTKLVIESTAHDVSQLDSGFGGGVVVGIRSDDSRAVYGLNVEYITGEESYEYRQINNGAVTVVGEHRIESPAIAAGVFLGVDLSRGTETRFHPLVGIEIGALSPQGKVTYQTAGGGEESVDFGKTALYLSLFFTQEFDLSARFGIAGTLGFRGTNTSVESVATESGTISGGYAQEYSGLFLRLGLKISL